MKEGSIFQNVDDLIPQFIRPKMSIPQLVRSIGKTSFEARNLLRGAELFQKMIASGDTNWLGIAGAGIAGGMGGIVISLLKAGFIDIICSTGAQVYHDLHFAFGLPVKAIYGQYDDNTLRAHGDVRIYDIGIREKETLKAQDEKICQFIKDKYATLSQKNISSWELNYHLGLWVKNNAPHPERSFVVQAAHLGIPIFWDSLTNHSIAMNLTRLEHEGYPIRMSAQKDIFDSAAIVYASKKTGFLILGGGGPKNFIQQTGPTLNQIFHIHYEGADRGIQIGTAIEREGSLSGCTFGEAVTWGKYRSTDDQKLVHIWAEYSLVFPLLTAYVLDRCNKRKQKNWISKLPESIQNLKKQL
ncbi:deoxyhypusine synthase family protein [bacterium]|nr:deoxyhypusine synthase family protein [bacterium]RQV93652.1 MAG: hypothetical protein EH221_09165 [bacterium]